MLFVLLTLSPSSTTKVPYANNLDPYEMLSNLGVLPRAKLFDTQTTFLPTLRNIEAL